MSNSMDAFNPMSLPPRELVRLVWSRRKTWAGTTVVCGVLAAAFSLVMPRYWEASQGLVVRQETSGSTTGARPGKFADLYEMRTLQETILEIAKSNQVVVGTIEAVDGTTTPPSLEDIEKYRKRLKMLPPDGGEFGKTEVFYFTVMDTNRDRAIRLVGEECRQLDIALRDLRSQRAEGLIAELDQQAKVAAEMLETETQQLVEFEGKVGSDLGELRMLQSANSGQSDLRLEAVQLEADVRKFRTDVRENEQLLELLRAAEKDPQQLIATPNSLLNSQPALRRLKDGLTDAQIATSKVSGSRLPDHPQVQSAMGAERQIRTELHDELVDAIKGANIELQLARDRLDATQARLDNLQQRFEHLAELRAEYSNHLAAVDNLRISLDRARENLSAARASQAAAHSSSLVTRLDKPETGPYPAGIGRTMITAAGCMAGLMLGLGIVFLTARPGVERETVVRDVREVREERSVAPMVGVRPAPKRNEPAPKRTGKQVVETVATLAPAGNEWWDAAPTPASAPAAAAQTRTATPTRVAPAPIAATSQPTVDVKPTPAPRESRPEPQREPQRPAPRKRRETLPTAAGALPVTPGSLPQSEAAGTFGGMSLQEALQAAARQMSN